METPIGRCSLCQGTVVKDMTSHLGATTRSARCTSCGATEAPPDRVVQMQKPTKRQDLAREYSDLLQAQRDKNGRSLQDAISRQFLPAPKPCPHCGPIPMLDPNRFRGTLTTPMLEQNQTYCAPDISQYCQPGQNTGIPQGQQNR